MSARTIYSQCTWHKKLNRNGRFVSVLADVNRIHHCTQIIGQCSVVIHCYLKIHIYMFNIICLLHEFVNHLKLKYFPSVIRLSILNAPRKSKPRPNTQNCEALCCFLVKTTYVFNCFVTLKTSLNFRKHRTSLHVSSLVHLVLLSLAHIIFSNTFTGSPSNTASTSK